MLLGRRTATAAAVIFFLRLPTVLLFPVPIFGTVLLLPVPVLVTVIFLPVLLVSILLGLAVV